METSTISLLKAHTLELHYGFNDQTHTMDAFVLNKCNCETLNIIKEVGRLFFLEVVVETEPLGNGGIKAWFKIKEKEKSTIRTAAISALCVGLLANPVITSVSKIIEICIEKVLEDKELKDLEKQKLKLEIEKLKQDLDNNLDSNILIKKRKSNFYKTLDKYNKINQISFSLIDEMKSISYQEQIVPKSEFGKFILISDDLDPVEIEEAFIEIISPVLKKGTYKWKGIYNSIPIEFKMQSDEFKTLIQNGEIEFKNGFSINCALMIRRKIDNEGIIKSVGYEVIRVNSFFLNENPIETPEGKRHRQKKEATKAKQLKLFD
jgi:hypothetical protein